VNSNSEVYVSGDIGKDDLSAAINELATHLRAAQRGAKRACEKVRADGHYVDEQVEKDRAQAFALGVFATKLEEKHPMLGKTLSEALESWDEQRDERHEST
jgi:hypothetical protein